MPMRDGVSVKIRKSTYLKLIQFKKRFRCAKSINDVIQRLIEHYEKCCLKHG